MATKPPTSFSIINPPSWAHLYPFMETLFQLVKHLFGSVWIQHAHATPARPLPWTSAISSATVTTADSVEP